MRALSFRKDQEEAVRPSSGQEKPCLPKEHWWVGWDSPPQESPMALMPTLPLQGWGATQEHSVFQKTPK